MAYQATLNGNVFFSTDSLSPALGLLSASLSLKYGSAGLFTFSIAPTNQQYDNFHLLIDYVDVYRNGEIIFTGRVSSMQLNFDCTLDIEVEGMLSVLNDSIFRPTTHRGTFQNLLTQLLESHNAQVESAKRIYLGTIGNGSRNAYKVYENYETTYSRIDDLVETFGGYPIIRKTNGILYLDWPASITTTNGQSVNFGQNELSVEKSANAEDYITTLIPLGAEVEDEETGDRYRVTISSVNNGKDYIEVTGATNKIVGVHTWDDITNPDILLSTAQTYLAMQHLMKTTIKVTAIDLADTGLNVENFRIGTLVYVTSIPHSIDNQPFNCIEQTLNLLDPSSNKLTLGGVMYGFTVKANRSNLLNSRAIEIIVANYVTNQRVNNINTTLNSRITYNYTLIEQNAQQISLKANQTTVDALTTEVHEAELLITPEAITSTVLANTTYQQSLNYTNLVPSLFWSENENGKTFTADGITWTTFGEGRVRAAGVAERETYYMVSGYTRSQAIPVISIYGTKKYRLHGAPNSSCRIYARCCTSSQTPDGTIGTDYVDYGSGVTIPTGYRYVEVFLLVPSGYDCGSGINFWPMLEVGETDHNFVSSRGGLGGYTERITQAFTQISQNATAITLKASQTSVDNLTGRVANCESAITVQAGQISSKVSTTDYNGNTIATLINQNATTVAINASKINLNGAVTANNYFKIKNDGSMECISGKIAGWTINEFSLGKPITSSGVTYTPYIYAPATPTLTDSAFGVRLDWTENGVAKTAYPFYVQYNGKLIASGVDISGTVHMTDGDILIASTLDSTSLIFLNSTVYNANIILDSGTGRDVYTSSGYMPIGVQAYTNWIPITSYKNNHGAVARYQGYYWGIWVNEDNIRYVAGKQTISGYITYDSTNAEYYGAIDVNKGYSGVNIAKVAGVVYNGTQVGYVAANDGSGNPMAYLWGGDGGYCNAYHFGTPSDRKLKRDGLYLDLETSARFIYGLKAVSYLYKNTDNKRHHGFFADEVEAILYEKTWGIVDYSKNPTGSMKERYKMLQYLEFIPDMVATIQLQHNEIEELKAQLAALM